jgi:hypothetical protein
VPRGEQLQLGAAGHQPFARVEQVADVLGIRRDGGDPDQGTPMQLQMACLSRADLEPASKLSDNWPHGRPFLLE